MHFIVTPTLICTSTNIHNKKIKNNKDRRWIIVNILKSRKECHNKNVIVQHSDVKQRVRAFEKALTLVHTMMLFGRLYQLDKAAERKHMLSHLRLNMVRSSLLAIVACELCLCVSDNSLTSQKLSGALSRMSLKQCCVTLHYQMFKMRETSSVEDICIQLHVRLVQDKACWFFQKSAQFVLTSDFCATPN